MADASEVKPGERDPNTPPGLIPIAVVLVLLATRMYVLFPGHGPIQGHATAPAASADKG